MTGEFTLGLLFPDGENSSLPHRGFGDVTSKVMEELSYFLLQNGQLEAIPVSFTKLDTKIYLDI